MFFCTRGFFQSSGACWSTSAPSWTPSPRRRQLGWFALCWTSSWTWRLPQVKRWSSVWSASSGPKWRRGPSSDRRSRWDLCHGSSLLPCSGRFETKAEFDFVFTLISPDRYEYHPDFYNLVDASLNDFRWLFVPLLRLGSSHYTLTQSATRKPSNSVSVPPQLDFSTTPGYSQFLVIWA